MIRSVINRYVETLPAGDIAEEVNRQLANTPRLVITAPPGAGKSTLLPLTILDAIPEGKILMLEPRRIAARQVALRMASMIGEKPGDTIGYRIRFESKVSTSTRIEVITEGILERMLVDDPTLDGVAAVIFDEFHERSLTSDFSLALTLEAQKIIRPDLRVIIMSATIDATTLCSTLDAPLVESKGKLFDITTIYLDETSPADCAKDMARAIARAHRENSGDILAFLPGNADIDKCRDLIGDALDNTDIYPLYGLLSAEAQQRAISPSSPGRRKVVLSTSIAETSLTIEGVSVVVDSGLCRTMRYEPSTGLSRLVTTGISLDMATQRRGRAGRLRPGVCYRLWSRPSEFKMAPNRTPEIVNADLAPMLLNAAAWGEPDPLSLPWITPPAPGHVQQARTLLISLGALSDDGAISTEGRSLAALPSHPRISKMLLHSESRKLRALAADIAAIIEGKDPMASANDADINSRITTLRLKRRSHSCSGPWKRIEAIAAQYRRLTDCQPDSDDIDPYNTGMLIAMAYPERIAMASDNGLYRLSGGESVILDADDNLHASRLLAVAQTGTRIFLASPLDPDTARSMATEHDNVAWDSRAGKVVARKELRIGSLLLESKPLAGDIREQVLTAICWAAGKEGRQMFDFNEAVQRLQQRVATLASWHPEMELPDVATDALMECIHEWLPMYVGNASSVQELRKTDMCAVITGMLDYRQQIELDRLAPSHFTLPCGRRCRIDYRQGASAPVISARLQDCFGLLDTPRLDDGRRPVLMELLSPGFKPVQLTQDLRGFWSNTYFEVRKELRRRYPKHRWPDNPLDL